MPRQREQGIAHEDRRRLVGRDPDAGQLRAQLERVGHLARNRPQKIRPGLAVGISCRLPVLLLVVELLVGLRDVAVEEAVDALAGCEPFPVPVQEDEGAQLEAETQARHHGHHVPVRPAHLRMVQRVHRLAEEEIG